MNALHPSNRAGFLAAVACICALLPLAAARAQTAPANGPLPSPATAPESRLTVTPAEFGQWLAGQPPAVDTAVALDPESAIPSLVTPPPPPPTLVTPPPPPAIMPMPALPTVTPTAPTAPVPQPPAEPQIATLPPNSPVTIPPVPALESPARPNAVKILYPEGDMELPAAAKPDLEKLAAWLRQNPNVRVRIVGYASGSDKAGNEARRTSLRRTLAVRKYLVDNGVLSTRMSVQALGAKTEELPRDRVEVSIPPS